MTDSDQADHAEITVQRMAEMHAEHERSQSPLQRRVSSVTSLLSRPLTAAFVAAIVLTWMVLNTVAGAIGLKAWDAARHRDP